MRTKKLPPIHPGEHLADSESRGPLRERPGVAAASAGQPHDDYHPGEASHYRRDRLAPGAVFRNIPGVLNELADQV